MERIDVKTAAVGVLLVFAISWFFNVEVLFLLGTAVAIGLGLMVGLLVGAMTLAERLHVVLIEEKKWSEVRASASRQSVAG